jgi:hypothetical protein
MRQKLNENPVAQIALVGVMLVIVGFLFISKMGGGESSPEAAVPATSEEEAAAPVVAEPVTTPGTAPVIPASTAAVSAPAARSLPHKVDTAYAEDKTIAVLIVRDGGIDDHLVREATEVTEKMTQVAFFSAKAKHVARFAQITGPLGVNQTPALIVIRPKDLNDGRPAPASVDYGFQTKVDIRQAVRDAVYRGRTLTYAPN